MPQGSQNYELVGTNCQNIQGLTVILDVSEDLVTSQNGGFSLQLNALPPPGMMSQGETLNWLQYIIYIQNGTASYEIQYWALGASLPWPPGVTPAPNTTPWLPALPTDYQLTSFGSAPSSQLLKGSALKIALETDSSASANVTSATFSITDPTGSVSSKKFTFPAGALYPICAFEVDLVGPGGLSTSTFTSGAGQLTYSVSAGEVCAQPPGTTGVCSFQYHGTGENSNAFYGPIIPNCGSLQTQQITTAPGVSGLTVNPDILWTGQSATGTVTLNEPALPGGTTVELVVSGGFEEASFVTVPATVLVLAGDTSATFTITTSATAWGVATITAGGPDGNALSIAVEIWAGQMLLALPLSAGYLLIGQTATGTISVRTPAPASGGLITLSTSNSAVVSITPAVVDLPSGSTSATFTVTALSAGVCTISANYLGDSATTNPFAVRQEPPPGPPRPPGPKPI